MRNAKEKYDIIHCNDINGKMIQLFKDAVDGKYANETRWIDREEFNERKGTDAYIANVWSFGNNGETYLYSKEVERWKKALHFAYCFNDYSLFNEFGVTFSDEQKKNLRKTIKENETEYKEKYIKWYTINVLGNPKEVEEIRKIYKKTIKQESEKLRKYLCDALKESGLTQAEVCRRLNTQMQGHYFGKSQWAFPTREEYKKMQGFMPLKEDYDSIVGLKVLAERLQSLQSLESLERLQSLESLERLQSLQSLQFTSLDYRKVEIMEDSVIYCDIPYIGINGDTKATSYNNGNGGMTDFNHEEFYEWAERQKNIFISSYDMPRDRFKPILEIDARSSMGHSGTKTTERIFLPYSLLFLIFANIVKKDIIVVD